MEIASARVRPLSAGTVITADFDAVSEAIDEGVAAWLWLPEIIDESPPLPPKRLKPFTKSTITTIARITIAAIPPNRMSFSILGSMVSSSSSGSSRILRGSRFLTGSPALLVLLYLPFLMVSSSSPDMFIVGESVTAA